MNNLDNQYQNILNKILTKGNVKRDRTGTGTMSIFGSEIYHDMGENMPILTTKKVHFKSVVVELLWFLRGDTNIKYLLENNCNIWDGDVYKRYMTTNVDKLQNSEMFKLEAVDNTKLYRYFTKQEFIQEIKTNDVFCAKWGDLGPIYGKQWCDNKGINQLENQINLLKKDPDSRRLVINSWNVSKIAEMILPPCHYTFQLYSRELLTPPFRSLSLKFSMRSTDVPLGLPFNLASYGLLLQILSRMVEMSPEILIASLGDAHIYLNQIEGVQEQLNRSSFDVLPTLKFSENFERLLENYLKGKLEANQFFSFLTPDMFSLENYISHPQINFPLSN